MNHFDSLPAALTSVNPPPHPTPVSMGQVIMGQIIMGQVICSWAVLCGKGPPHIWSVPPNKVSSSWVASSQQLSKLYTVSYNKNNIYFFITPTTFQSFTLHHTARTISTFSSHQQLPKALHCILQQEQHRLFHHSYMYERFSHNKVISSTMTQQPKDKVISNSSLSAIVKSTVGPFLEGW